LPGWIFGFLFIGHSFPYPLGLLVLERHDHMTYGSDLLTRPEGGFNIIMRF